MNREARLQSAKTWLSEFEGKHHVKSYPKWYGVDKICAIRELRMLGVEIDQSYEEGLKRQMEALAEHRRQRKLEKQLSEQAEIDELTQCSYGFP